MGSLMWPKWPGQVIHEFCEDCGTKQAEIIGDNIVISSHKCPQAPTGPPASPMWRKVSETVFVQGTRIRIERDRGTWWGYVDGERVYGSRSPGATLRVCRELETRNT